MLKITIHESAKAIRIRLEGKLTAAWVTELENCWRAAGKPVQVDLSAVDYVDVAGKYLLELMHAYGAELVSPTLPLQDTVRQIEARPRSSGIVKLAILVLAAGCLVPARGAEPIRLTLKRAVEIAVSPEGSARIQFANELVRQAESRSAQARAALLPNLEASVGQQNRTMNLEAMGIGLRLNEIPGLNIPTFVGPFNTFDVRANVQQSIFDFSSIRRYQSSRSAVDSARAERSNADDQVAAQVARAYLAAVKTDADVRTAEANVQLAKATLDLVQNQKAAGTGTGIEVTRARVQLANEDQRLLVAQNDRRRARLQLLRTMGLRMDADVELADQLAYIPVNNVTLDQARQRAFENRSDLRAQQEREESARLSSSATTMERLPSIAAFADYGSIGTGINDALPTRTYGVQVRVPIFDGGRRDARRAESQSLYRQEQVRTRDLRDDIELELRTALDLLESANQQFQVASEGLKLADNELAQAQRRYRAGVVTSIEVTDAQTRLQRARDNYTSALFAYNVARVDLAAAQGTIEDVTR
jgi:outer membrane protein TolC